jgi:hypothetical protein
MTDCPQNNAIHQTRHHDDLVSPFQLCGLVMAALEGCVVFDGSQQGSVALP